MAEKIERQEEIEEAVSKYIFTISAADYISSKEYASAESRSFSDFNFRGIEAIAIENGPEIAILSAKKKMLGKALELMAEIVVDLKASIQHAGGSYMVCLFGTALIPKEKYEH